MLTAEQRYHLEVAGYVVVPTIDPAKLPELLATVRRLHAAHESGEHRPRPAADGRLRTVIEGTEMAARGRPISACNRVSEIYCLDRAQGLCTPLADHFEDPAIVGIAQECVGQQVRKGKIHMVDPKFAS